MSTPLVRKLRCAVYTRKSTEEGLEKAFNSLDAQRAACEAYVVSQKQEGWVLYPDHFDDGGFSGGTLERPALKRLLADIENSRVDVVVVYKIDRLSRSLMDFAKLVEVFDRCQVTFVSITQSFNTTTSMGRLTLNILLSFAQFEREVIGERVRDKIAASRARGLWMGGTPPFGYRVDNRKLAIVDTDAAIVRMIFERFSALGSTTVLARRLAAEGVTTRRGKPFDKRALSRILNNRVYLGEAVHKGTSHPGEHQAIIEAKLWAKAHPVVRDSPRARAAATRARTPALLKGLLFSADGRAMTPTHTRKKGRLYRYYIASKLLEGDGAASLVNRVPAAVVEAALVGRLRHLLRAPEIVARTWAAVNTEAGLAERDVCRALADFEPLWDELFPAEQTRIVRLLVERVKLASAGMHVRLRLHGLQALIEELHGKATAA